MKLSVVAPVYNEEKNVPEFVRRLTPLLEAHTSDYEIVFCLDPCRDRTEEAILELRRKDPRVKLLRFSRRVGQPMATLAGLEYSAGDAAIVMDVDLQDPPELVAELIAKWREGYDVVIPQRRTRTGEPFVKRLVAATGYWVIERIANVPIPPNTGDFRLMSRRVVDEIVRLKECHGFLRGMVAFVGFKQILIPFDRPARFAGQTNYNRFLGSLRLGFNGLVCDSNALLALSNVLGCASVALAVLTAAAYIACRLAGIGFPVAHPGLVALGLFLAGVQLLSLGLLGSYIGRIYEEVRQRPKYLLDRVEGFEARSGAGRSCSER